MTESAQVPKRAPRRGTLLVASPRLLDPNFMHAVVLVCEHTAEGTFGLILNRPLAVRVKDLESDAPLLRGREDAVFAGGPVARGELHVLHVTEGEVPGSMDVVDGVRFGGDPERIREALAAAPGAAAKFVVGYAGWGPGQLDAEMEEESWVVLQASRRRVFDPHPETLWRRVLRAEGGDVAALADVPPDPSWN